MGKWELQKLEMNEVIEDDLDLLESSSHVRVDQLMVFETESRQSS